MVGVADAVLRAGGATGQKAQLISRWKFDETSGLTAVDSRANSDGQFTSPELGLDPLLADGGRSVGFNGTSTDVWIPHVAAFQIVTYSIVCYVQFDSGPSAGSNKIFLSKDIPSKPGGLSLEIYNDTGTLKLRGYTRDSSGAATWIGEQTGVAALSLNEAYRITLTVNASGARLYLNDLLVASTTNGQGLQSNDQLLVIGSYHGITGWIAGVIDDVQLYEGALEAAEVQALPAPQSITRNVPAPTALTRPTLALATGKESLPSSNMLFVAPSGSDGNPGTEASPKATLAGAHSALPGSPAGWTIVCRGGRYDLSSTFAPTKSGANGDPVKVMAYPGETVILDRAYEFRRFLTPGQGNWTLFDSGKKIWRSGTNGEFSSGRVEGHWEELDEAWKIYGTTDPNGTGVADGNATGSNYVGPMLWIGTDGRLYCRMQKPNASRMSSAWPSYMKGISGGVWAIPASEDPNDYPIYVHRFDGSHILALSSISDWEFYDINMQNASQMIELGSGSINRVKFIRGQQRNASHLYRTSSSPGGTNALSWHEIQFVDGRWDIWPWHLPKQETDMDDYGCHGSQFSNLNGFEMLDCLIYGFFDFAKGGQPPGDLVVKHCWFEHCFDDFSQWTQQFDGYEVAFCVFNATPSIGCQGGGDATELLYFHHNIIAQHRKVWLWRPGDPTPMPQKCQTSHGSGFGKYNHKIYNNTFLIQPGATTRWAISVGHADARTSAGSGPSHETANNIFLVISDENGTKWVNGEGGPTQHDIGACRHDESGNEDHDYNHYEKVLQYSPALSSLIGPTKQGNSFSSVSAFFSATGFEQHGTDVLLTGQNDPNAACSLVDAYNLDIRPKAGSEPASGARALASTGWPGATDDSYRGAVDPATGLCPDGFRPGPRIITLA